MSKHTPGIWNIHPSSVENKPFIVDSHDGEPWISFSQWIGNDKNNIIASVEMSTAKGGHGWVRSVEEAKANAKLIAAAPTMSATLKRAAHVLAELPQEQQTPEMLALRREIVEAIKLSTPEYYGLDAAINKAEGKA